MKIKAILILCNLCFFVSIYGQNAKGSGTDIESIIPQQVPITSPTMASLGQYGTYAVSYSNGLPQIEIPIYEIVSGDLKQPIVLSYHGGGIKVSEEASWVGLGWSLSYGGSISRSINGKVDGLYGGENLSNLPDRAELNQLFDTYKDDPENGNLRMYLDRTILQDIYTYECSQGSGMFVLDNNNVPMLIPEKPFRLENNFEYSKTLTSADGTVYEFEAVSWTTPPKDQEYVSSWGIKKIISPYTNDEQDKIEYFYEHEENTRKVNYLKYISFTHYPYNDSLSISGNESSNSQILSRTNLLSCIFFRGGVVRIKTSLREDLLENTSSLIKNSRKLDAIEVYQFNNDLSERLIKKIEFVYDPSSNAKGKRLKLVGIKEIGVNGEIKDTKFDYYNYPDLPSKTSYDYDYWGYYNGADNSSPIPEFYIGFVKYGGADKTPNGKYMSFGSLKSISYPTGGTTFFNWEPNIAYSEDNKFPIAPLKCASVIPTQINGYENFQHSNTTIPNPAPAEETIIDVAIDQTAIVSYRLYRTSDEESHKKFDRGHIIIRDETLNTIAFEYSELNAPDYRTVKIHLKKGHQYSLQFHANCTTVKGQLSIEYRYLRPSLLENGNIEFGGLRIESIENKDQNNSIVSKKKFTYLDPSNNLRSSGYIKTSLDNIDFATFRRTIFRPPTKHAIECTRDYYYTTTYYSNALSGIYSSPVAYQFVQEYNYGINGVLNGYTQYEYPIVNDVIHSDKVCESMDWKRSDLLGKKVYKIVGTSQFELLREEKNYYSLHDGYKRNSTGFQMIQLLNIEMPQCIQEKYYDTYDLYSVVFHNYESYWKHLDSTITTEHFVSSAISSITKYNYTHTSHLKPYSIVDINKNNTHQSTYNYNGNGQVTLLKKNSNGTLTNHYVFEYKNRRMTNSKEIINNSETNKKQYLYLQNRLNQIDKENDISKVIEWAYFDMYPVIVAENTNYLELGNAFSSESKIIGNKSFETLEEYLWAIKDFLLPNGTLDKAKVTSWQNFTAAVRTALPHAVISFYTYEPLVGMTSQTDPNGNTVYYEYDGFGRLKCVRDMDGNILKVHEYNYAQPTN